MAPHELNRLAPRTNRFIKYSVPLRTITCFAIICSTSTTHAQPLAVDESISNPGTAFISIHTANDLVFICANDGIHGQEVWCFDPDQSITYLVQDLNPGREAGLEQHIVTLNDHIVFEGSGPNKLFDLWFTNGKKDDIQLLADLPHRTEHGTRIRSPLVVEDDIYFVADDGYRGYELWRLSIATRQAHIVKDLHPPEVFLGTSTTPGNLGSTVIFRATVEDNPGELWRTDGTDEGTIQISIPGMDVESAYGGFTPFPGALAFVASNEELGNELWRTDGTPAGTYPIADIWPGTHGSESHDHTPFGDRILFRARDLEHGEELWITDGTADGTTLIKDIEPGPAHSSPAPFRISGDVAFFVAETTKEGRELWRTDGTTDGTRPVFSLIPGVESSNPYSITPFAEGVLFSGEHKEFGEELWYTDGTPEGTRIVKDIYPGSESSAPYHLVVLDDVAYFEAEDGIHGTELWRSDGTTEGTYLVADITWPSEPAPSSDPRLVTIGPKHAYFVAQDREGRWSAHVSDTTADGTAAMLGSPISGDLSAWIGIWPTTTGSYFAYRNEEGIAELWFYDHTLPKTDKLFDLGSEIGASFAATVNPSGKLFFARNDILTGTELWSLSSPSGDPIRLTDIALGPANAEPSNLTWANDALFFSATNAQYGRELWRWDDTGPTIVRDIHNQGGDANPTELTPTTDGLYFIANDGTTGLEIWRYNFVEKTCRLVKDINPTQHTDASPPSELTSFGDALLFAAHDGVHGYEPWLTRGTDESTTLLADLFAGPASSNPNEMTLFKEKAFFRAESHSKGIELFVTDGTPTGTHIFADLVHGAPSSTPIYLTNAGPILLFAAWAEDVGQPNDVPQVWRTDGVRTHRVNTWRDSESRPRGIYASNDAVFLLGESLTYGRELWHANPKEIGSEMPIMVVKDLLPRQRLTIPLRRPQQVVPNE